MNLIIFILASFGITQILVFGHIFKHLREKIGWYMLTCPMCMGFWAGMLIFVLMYCNNMKIFDDIFMGMLMSGWISSGTSYILCNIFDDDGIKIKKSEKNCKYF